METNNARIISSNMQIRYSVKRVHAIYLYMYKYCSRLHCSATT